MLGRKLAQRSAWANEDLDSKALSTSFLGWANMFQGHRTLAASKKHSNLPANFKGKTNLHICFVHHQHHHALISTGISEVRLPEWESQF